MKKREPQYSKNQRVEFMDCERFQHVGYIKAAHKLGIFKKEIWYDICEMTKERNRRVFFVPEYNIFGLIEHKKDKLTVESNFDCENSNGN